MRFPWGQKVLQSFQCLLLRTRSIFIKRPQWESCWLWDPLPSLGKQSHPVESPHRVAQTRWPIALLASSSIINFREWFLVIPCQKLSETRFSFCCLSPTKNKLVMTPHISTCPFIMSLWGEIQFMRIKKTVCYFPNIKTTGTWLRMRTTPRL